MAEWWKDGWEAETWRGGGEARGEGMARNGEATTLSTMGESTAHSLGQAGVCVMRANKRAASNHMRDGWAWRARGVQARPCDSVRDVFKLSNQAHA
mmetsp:Transcript_9381/g.28495  ORF Transcript_9381/g.28495 Transcript_9381/m.28495 type:complete len:96 (-) Transcript_9381:61-348(-)